MKKVLLVLTVCCLSSYSLAQTQQEPAAGKETPKPPVSAPKIKAEVLRFIPDEVFSRELKDLDGQSFFLSTYRGQVFVINLWATWCGPCHSEIPELNKVYEDYSGRGVEFVGLTMENPKEDLIKVRQFAKEFKMKYKVGWVDEETGKALMNGNYSLPQTFVVGPDGRVVTLFRGYSAKSIQMLRDRLEKALNPAYEPPQPAESSDAPLVRP